MDTTATEANESNEKKEISNVPAERIESILKGACLVFFILLVISQAMMTIPSFRAYSGREVLEGTALGSEAYLFGTCKMELKLSNMEYCPELKVLVNGEEAGAFWEDTIMLELKEGDVVELDASKLLVKAEVRVTAVSSSLADLLGRSFEVYGGLVRVNGQS
jgi:hypothetical protein